jgi:PAS domain S-box-containing protein
MDQQARELPPAVRSLIEARTGDAVFIVGPDYRIVYWDERMESLTGTLSEEALGRRCFGVVLGEREDGGTFCAHGCSVMHLASKGRPVSSYDMRIRARSGERRWVNVSNLSVQDGVGPHVRSLLQAVGAHSQLEVLARAREMRILTG